MLLRQPASGVRRFHQFMSICILWVPILSQDTVAAQRCLRCDSCPQSSLSPSWGDWNWGSPNKKIEGSPHRWKEVKPLQIKQSGPSFLWEWEGRMRRYYAGWGGWGNRMEGETEVKSWATTSGGSCMFLCFLVGDLYSIYHPLNY